VSLPNGEVLVVGGSSVSQQLDTAAKYAEIWNPTTGQWRVAVNAVKASIVPFDIYSLARCNRVGWWSWWSLKSTHHHTVFNPMVIAQSILSLHPSRQNNQVWQYDLGEF
jgi:hypothetical protein